MGWAKTYLKLAEDKDKPSVIPGLVATGLGATAAGAMPALSLHEYLTKTHPTAHRKLRRATEVKHDDLSGLVRPGDTILHGPLVGVSTLATANNIAGTLPSGLPATHAAFVHPDMTVIEGGHMLTDSIKGPINDPAAWSLYGRRDSDLTLSSRIKDPAKRKKRLDDLAKEHEIIRDRASKRRAALASKSRLRKATEGLDAYEHLSPAKSVEKYLGASDERGRPQMVLRRRVNTPLTPEELEYLAKQTEIDKFTPYGASSGALAGLKTLLLPRWFRSSKAKPSFKVCDPGTNICSSVPARALQRLTGEGSLDPKDTLPGHLLTDFRTAPVAVTRKKEWMRQLAAAKRYRTLAGLGGIGLTGLLGGGLGYSGYLGYKALKDDNASF